MIDPGNFSFNAAMTNLTSAFQNIQQLVVALSYVMGLGMMAKGVMMYRIFASQTFASAQRGEIAGPMVWIVVGAILIYLPSTIDSTMATVFGTTEVAPNNELLGYGVSGIPEWVRLADVIIGWVKLIGLIAFVRGWVILSKMGHSGAQPGSIGKGIIHIIGGILLFNLIDTVNILARTFGYVAI